MVFSLSALWWRRIRGLWKLPDGRDWLWGKLGLVLTGGAMLSKSSIQFSVDGQGCVPSLLLEWVKCPVQFFVTPWTIAYQVLPSMGFWWGHHYLLYLHQNSREGTHLLPSTENGIKDLLNMVLPIKIRPSFSLSLSGSFHKPLILIHQRVDRLKTKITRI